MRYRLAFNGQLYQNSGNALRGRIAQIIERPDFDGITVLFSSEGGSTDEGLALYNFIQSSPVPIHMHAVGHVGSMAIPVFLAGHKRTCGTFSRFFFHAYDWGFDGRQMTDRVAEALQRLRSDIELSSKIAERHTTLSTERLAQLYHTSPTPTILTPQEARDAGVVEDVLDLNPSGTPEPDVALWTVAWT
ncbi:ClpP family protease [Thalassobaculum litoreum]|uniref:ATP-dependent protease ClpP, protease subunit n=1 Tax=Thalassobaculum litoreum DSM 18839 TaxID=1123362 RepID=A0A8G2BLU0_9PROT|nr:ATP-dependent Clp protease proteolytic subunit [Thalassobaculum litoreum]SDG44427.1 ATP-dependent protease ClpP, protease subunit [Thalassobaculum litoreum DSM 18839]